MRVYFTLLGLFLLVNSGFGQLQWPVQPINQQHGVVGSIGECRESNLHYHMGVDITNGSDINVYSIEAGTIFVNYTGNCWTSYIDVTNSYGRRIRYYHVKPSSNQIYTGIPVGQGILIGKMFSAGGCNLHVHIEKLNGNFLNSELSPFIDNSDPIIGDLSFCLDGATFNYDPTPFIDKVDINNVDYLLLHNKVDIIAASHDTRLDNNGNADGGYLAPFIIEYEIFNSKNQSVDGTIINYDFSNPPPNTYVQYAFKHGSTLTSFSYILTNDPNPSQGEPPNKYLNTILRKNTNETWNLATPRARYNTDSHYSDGIYNLKIKVKDVDNENNPRHVVSSSSNLLFDNFRPYVSRVKIYEGPSSNWDLKYNRGWQWAENGLLFEPQSDNIKFDQNQNVKVEIITSEPMKEVRLNIGSYDNTITCGSDLNKTCWEFVVPLAGTTTGNKQLNIYGFDLADNPLQDKPDIIPIRQADGSWLPLPTSGPGPVYNPDKYHSFIFGSSKVDFLAEQIGWNYNTIQFTDKSSVSGSYSWLFGDNTTSPDKDPLKYYANYGVYMVTHSVGQYSITKPVSVNNLSAPVIKNIFASPQQGGGKKSTNATITINLDADCEGIIGSYLWQIKQVNNTNIVYSSSLPNPTNIVLQENTQYEISLTITNFAGQNTKTEPFYFDPTTYPYGCIHDWEVTYFLHDLEISTENFDENQPFDFSIDFGDGTSDAVSGHYLPYYTFTHQYFTTGSFVVFATVKGKDYSGHDVTLRFAKEISVSQDQLEVNILPDNGSSPVHPLQDVTFIAIVDGPQCQDGYWGSWAVFKTGDPTYYYSKNFSGQTIEPLEYSFPSPGIYRIIIDVIENVSNPGLGHCEYILEITPAPKFIDCEIAAVPSILSLDANYTFYGNTFPIGDPGIAEANWFPTNVRWTLIKSDGTKQVLKEEEFPYTNSIFSRYVTYHFTESGNYTLRMEAWNNTHDYEQNNQLDPHYANTISYYDYDEIQFYVSADIASLTITEPVETYFEPDANGTTLIIKITNPSSSQINWTAEQSAGCGIVSWFHIFNTYGNGLCCGNEQAIIVNIESNPEKDNRFGCVKIVGKYPNGTEVQGSPAYIQIDQYGTDGPAYALIEGEVLNHYFGESVAIEGRLAVIGSPSTNNSAAGEAFVYEKSSVGTWEKQCTLKSSDNNPDFGSKVDISGDNVCVSGEHKIYFFKKSLPNWAGIIFESKMVSLPFVSDVSIWGDYAVAGVPSDDEKGTNAGAVFVYYRNQSGIDNWGLVEKINDCNSQDYFGNSVDIYNDVLVVGAPQKDAELGYIKIYNRNYELMNDWGLEQTIYGEYSYACSGWNMKFGKSVSIFENVISAPYYQIYNSFNGPIPEILFPIYSKNNGIWSLIANDYLIPDPPGNGITSTSIYKDIDPEENIEPQYQYESYSGFPSAFHTDGTSGCDAQSYFFKYYNTTLYRSSWGGYSTYDDLYTRKGNSVSLSYNSSIVGIPGMKQGNNIIGAVEINRKANKSDLCEAGISLSLINFNLPAGTYSDVVAESIALGGRAFPATIQSGATITYQANEILLQDGFLADHGSLFTAESQECESTLSDAPDKNQWNLVDINKWPLNDESKRYLIRTYMKALPDLPWQSIDVASKIDFEESSITESKRDNTEQNFNRFFPSVGTQKMDGISFPVIVITDLLRKP